MRTMATTAAAATSTAAPSSSGTNRSLLTDHCIISDVPADKKIGAHIADTLLAGECIHYKPAPSSTLVKADFLLAPLNPMLFMTYPVYARHHLAYGLERPYVLHFNWM